MQVRTATKFDIPILLNMLGKYRSLTPLECLSNSSLDKAEKILTHIIAGAGVAIIAEKDEQPIGMMLGIISDNIWDNDILMLKELAYWVDVEHRGGTAGYRLLNKYNEIAKQYHDMGRIKLWTVSKMSNSPNLSYEKFGYKKIEETYCQGTEVI